MDSLTDRRVKETQTQEGMTISLELRREAANKNQWNLRKE